MTGKLRKFFSSKGSVATPSQLSKGVCHAYSKAATDPRADHPFPIGRRFAHSLGYPDDLLDSLPEAVSESFTGVSNVSVFAEIPTGSTVLDLGCGAGLDSFIAARKTGITGRVIGVDFSASMIKKARDAKHLGSHTNILFHCASAQNLPIADESIDVLLVNGIFNLNPFRQAIFKETARILKPGGSSFVAELILKKPHRPKNIRALNDWFS